MKDASSPSLVRIRRVNYFLEREPKYNTSTEVENFVKGNDKIPFPKSTWTVARAIHVAGLDPCIMGKDQIYEWANFVLFNGPAPKGATQASAAVVPKPDGKTETVAATTPTATPHEEPVATINVPVRVAIYTLLVSARELTRLDRKPGAEDLGKQIDIVANNYLTALNQTEHTYLNSPKAEVKKIEPVAEKAAVTAVASTPAPVAAPTPQSPPVPTPA
jgi:hypothetical protein